MNIYKAIEKTTCMRTPQLAWDLACEVASNRHYDDACIVAAVIEDDAFCAILLDEIDGLITIITEDIKDILYEAVSERLGHEARAIYGARMIRDMDWQVQDLRLHDNRITYSVRWQWTERGVGVDFIEEDYIQLS